MAICSLCNEEYPDSRLQLNLTTCLSCGNKEAEALSNQRQLQILPQFHKGGYTYVSPTAQRELLLTATSKVSRDNIQTSQSEKLPAYRQKKLPANKWSFSHWVFYYDPKLKRRVKRAVLILQPD